MSWIVVCLVLALAPAGSGSASAESLEGFDAYVRRAVAEWEVPGLAVAVVKDGEVVFAAGYGVHELGRPERVDTHTIFSIGSTTKAMTAAALGMLVDEGKIAWDDRVTEHLPEFELYDPYVTREVTIRDLLTHRAGLPNADYLWYGRDASPEDIIFRLRYVEPETSFRSAFTYQNIMYATAGAVVAKVSGVPWEAFVRTRIFEPLGMDGTIATAATLRAQPNVASPHDRVDGAIRVIENASVDAVAPAGAVWSSVADMAKWMRFLLEGKTADGVELLKPETLAELFRPQMFVDADEFYPTQILTKPHWMTYGFGWFQHDYEGRAVDFHTGSIDGMVAIHGLIRDERLGVIVLGNLDHAELRHALMYRVFDLYSSSDETPRRDWSAELQRLYAKLGREAERRAAEAEAKRILGTSPTLSLDRYTGVYEDRLYGKIEMIGDANGLRLRYGPGLRGALHHWNYDVFRVHWDAAWRGKALVQFALGTGGSVETLRIGNAVFHRRRAE